jgi:hypothetical protein
MLLNKKALRVTKTVIKDSDLLRRIRKKIIKNRQAQQLRNNDKVKKREDIITYHKLIYVSKMLRNKVIRQEHDEITLKYFKVNKTMK